MELRDYVRVVRDHLKVIGVITLVGLLCGLAFGLAYPKTYVSSAKLFARLRTTSSQATAANSAVSASQFILQRMSSYTQLSSSDVVLHPVIDALGLHESVAQLARSVTITNPTDTVILVVSVSSDSAGHAAKIANQVASSLSTAIENLEGGTSSTVSPVVVSITQRAVVPSSPTSPNRKLDVLLGLVVGIAIGLVVAVVRHQRRAPVDSPRDVEELTGARPVGVFAPTRGRRRAASRKAYNAEVARRVCGHLVGSPERSARTVLITAPSDRGGLDEVTASLARAAARMHASVCVVDADLRNPSTATSLGAEDSEGLAAVLEQRRSQFDVSRRDAADEFTVIASREPTDSARLLSEAHVGRVFAELRARFDLVLVVAPTLDAGPDAQLLARNADASLLVVRSRRTTQLELSESLAALVDVGARVGTVLTGMRGAARGPRIDAAPTLVTRTRHSASAPVPASVAAGTGTGLALLLDDEGADEHGGPGGEREIAGAPGGHALSTDADDSDHHGRSDTDVDGSDERGSHPDSDPAVSDRYPRERRSSRGNRRR